VKALVHTRYGGPEGLQVEDVPAPTPGSGEVLVRVAAASIAASDWEVLTGSPLYARIGGLRRPRRRRLGSDLAGTVERNGPAATRFQPGDRVTAYVGRLGCFAEYVVVPERDLVPIPDAMPHDIASTLPQSGPIALQGIRTKGGLTADQHVCVNGAGGGTGVLAVQLAKAAGAEVTAVDNGKKQEFMRGVGADHVVDYEREDVTELGARYDLVVDLAAHRSAFVWRRVLAAEGRYFLVGGEMRPLLQSAVVGPALRHRRLRVLAVRFRAEDIAPVLDLWVDGTLAPVIDTRFALDDVIDALRYVGEGRSCGKVVVLP
jgi:NADPH:quinone reductase-like Zn-dependent oxidoreductase